jgi:hypothetical protein
MRLSPLAFVRPAAFLMAGLTAVAVALGRGAPEAAAVHHRQPVRYHAINWYLFQQNDPTPRLLDAETGRLERVVFPDSGCLEYASCSPWRDDRGQVQFVGRWNEASGRSPGKLGLRQDLGLGLGLARYTYPGRQMLDRVTLDVVSGSVPCWSPGLSPVIVFAATDGRLYRYAFDEKREGRYDAGGDANRPLPLAWRCAPPGNGRVWIGDPIWPTDPRLGGKLVVALRTGDSGDPERAFSRSGLWWLRLNRDCTEIEDAGRLTDPAPDVEEHWPALASTAGGGPTLAFLIRREGQPGWRLRLAPVAIDRESGAPRADRPIVALPDEAYLPTPPIFSPDGRWVHIFSGTEHSPARLNRLSVGAILAATAPRPRPGPTQLADSHAQGDGATRPR